MGMELIISNIRIWQDAKELLGLDHELYIAEDYYHNTITKHLGEDIMPENYKIIRENKAEDRIYYVRK